MSHKLYKTGILEKSKMKKNSRTVTIKPYGILMSISELFVELIVTCVLFACGTVNPFAACKVGNFN